MKELFKWDSGNIDAATDAEGTLINSGGHIIQTDGAPVANRKYLNFIGNRIAITDDESNNATVVTGRFVCDETNTYGGDGAFVSHTTAINCTAIGHDALTNDLSGNYCVAIGSNCLTTNTTARGNIAIGADCLPSVIERDNIGIGLEALYSAGDTYNNIGIGTNALYSFLNGPNNNKTGENIAIGSSALNDLVYGSENIGICEQFGWYYGEYCVFIGMEAGDGNECGSYNVGVGAFACKGASGDGNVGIGENALGLETNQCNGIEEFSDYSGTIAGTVKAYNGDPWGFNLAPGVYTDMRIAGTYHYAGNYTITVIDANNFYFTHAWAGDDVAAGYWMAQLNYALYANRNTAVGYNAGYLNNSNSDCTYIGYNANTNNLDIYVNSMALGANSIVDKSNQVVIGDDNIVETQLKGTVIINDIGSTSWDFRVETDIYDALFVDAGNDSIEIMSNPLGKVGYFGVAAVAQSTGWAMSNVTPNKILDCDVTTLAEVADVLGTLIDTLKLNGTLGA